MLSFHCFTRHFLTLCALLPLLMALVAGDDLSWVPFDRKQFNGNATLDSKGNVQLFWKIGSDYSTYGIASKSKGFLAVGFSETGAMTGADIALGYMDASNKFVLENRNAAGFVYPQLSNDQKNNIRLKEGSQKDGVTGFVFEKKNKADCLQSQANVNTDSWQWFIYAFSDSNTFAQHRPGDNGNKYVKLGTGQAISINQAQDIPNAKNFTISQPEITVSTNETTYCYTLHKMPVGQKNFILGERPTTTSSLVHHQVIYSCWNITDEDKKMVGQEPNCDYENFRNPCYGFVTEWAPGMSARTYESGFGKPFGSDSYEYVMLETHFNNPNGLSGQKASAGYTLLYDDKPVQHEIGTLTLGDIQVTGWSLEPGKQLVSKTTVCTPDCTKNWPSGGITAFSVFFHMHQRGRNERVQVIRDGKEVTPLATIRNFEYGYQFSKTINEYKLLPGDRLVTTCEYDTSKDTKPVPGGLASKDEMCFAWVDYYPANDVLICSEIDLGYDPTNLLNGTIGYCQKKNTNPGSSINPFAPLNATWQALPASGNSCSNTSSGPSDTQSTKGSSASFTYGSLSGDVFSLLGSCFFAVMFAFEFL